MKHYAVEVDFHGRRRVTTARYATRAEAREACNRHAPQFRARIVAVRAEPAERSALPRAFDNTVVGAL